MALLRVVALVLSSPAAELPLALEAQEIPGLPNRDPDAELTSGTERVMRHSGRGCGAHRLGRIAPEARPTGLARGEAGEAIGRCPQFDWGTALSAATQFRPQCRRDTRAAKFPLELVSASGTSILSVGLDMINLDPFRPDMI